MPQLSPAETPEDAQTPWPAFSSDELLDVIRDVYRPGWRKAVVECHGETFRTLVSPRASPLLGLWQFPLFFERVASSGHAIPVPYLDSVCREITPAASGNPCAGLKASPFVDWAGVGSSWDGYLRGRTHAPGAGGFDTLMRKQRALRRDIGDVQVSFDDRDPATLRTLLAWKSAQYRRTGVIDRFALERNRNFYAEMARRGLLHVATLRAGGKLLAAHAGNHIGGRFLYRLPAYDPAFGRYSPGSLLLVQLLEHSFVSGDREFDFLLGAEPYKYTYATHVRWVGPLGAEPLRQLLARRLRGAAGTLLNDMRGYARVRDMLDRAGRGRHGD